MHPTTPPAPSPSRRAPRAPKNPRRRVRSESDRKKHAGWRHCPRCNRSVSTNGRNFYHHMHKCDRVYFADLIAKVDSAVTPVSTPLPPPVPRVQSSPITPAQTPKRTPVKLSEKQRVLFLQQLCFLRVYDRTVDAVLNQIEQSDASVFSPAAFEAVRRAKGIETSQTGFPNPKHFSPPYSPLVPSVHPPHPSASVPHPSASSIHENFTSNPIATRNAATNPQLVASQPIVNAPIVNGTTMQTAQLREAQSNLPNAAQGVNSPYASNASLNVSTSLPGNRTHVINPGTTPHIINNPSAAGNVSAPMIPQGQPSIQTHSMSGLPLSNGHMSQGLPIPRSSPLPGSTAMPERPVLPTSVTANLGVSQPSTIHSGTLTTPDCRAVSEPMRYSHNIGNAMHGVSLPGRIQTSAEIPVSGGVAAPPSGNLVQSSYIQRNEAMLGNAGIPRNQQAFSPTGNIGNGHAGSQPNLQMSSSLDPAVRSDGSWRRDAQRFSAPASMAPYSAAPYGSAPLSTRPQMSGVPNMSASAAAAANTPVSRVASAMSISSVINS